MIMAVRHAVGISYEKKLEKVTSGLSTIFIIVCFELFLLIYKSVLYREHFYWWGVGWGGGG